MVVKISMEYLLIVIVGFCSIAPCAPKISDKRLCYDDECSVPIAEAKTLTVYHSRDKDILSFPTNVDVTVFSKEAGSRNDLWGVEILGQRGYAPKRFIREKKVLHRPELLREVPTERIVPENTSQDHNVAEEKGTENAVSSSPSIEASPSFEIVDGTTLHFSDDSNSQEPAQSYSTRTLETEEQPILSVHPNVLSSEYHIKEGPSSATENPPSTLETPAPPPETSTSATKEEPETPNLIEKFNKNELKPEIEDQTAEPEKSTDEEIPEKIEKAPEPESSEPEPVSEEKSTESAESSATPQNYLTSAFQTMTSMFDALSTTESPLDKSDVIEDQNSEVVEEKIPEYPEPVELPEKNPEPVQEPEEEPEPVEKPEEDPEPVEKSEEDPEPVEKPEEDPEPVAMPANVPEKNSESPITPEKVPENIPEIQVGPEKNSEPQEITDQIPEHNPEIQVKPEHDPEPVVSPEKNPETREEIPEPQLSPGKNPEAQINPEKNSEAQVVPEIIPEAQINSEKNSEAQIITVTVSEAQVVPEKNPEPVQVPEKIPEAEEKNLDTVIEAQEIVPEEINNSTIEIFSGEPEYNSTSENQAQGGNNFAANEVGGGELREQGFEEIEGQPGINTNDEQSGPSQVDINKVLNFNGFPHRNLLNVESRRGKDNMGKNGEHFSPDVSNADPVLSESGKLSEGVPQHSDSEAEVPTLENFGAIEPQVTVDACDADGTCPYPSEQPEILDEDTSYDTAMDSAIKFTRNYWEAMSYVALTALTTLLFSLGYYYIENRRRDQEFIAKINKLEKELLVASKECSTLDDTLKSTKTKLTSIEDESFGSNEMVLSLKTELDVAHKAKSDLEDQVSSLEKDLEGATEAGLELERMLREILASNSAENPLAKSVEDLQTRLTAQQSANESLTSALHSKSQELETATTELSYFTGKCEKVEIELARLTEDLTKEREVIKHLQEETSGRIFELEKKMRDVSSEKINLRKQLQGKEMELRDLLDVIKQSNTHNIDFEKLADVSHVKAEAIQLKEERDELQIRLSEVEGAHELMEEHMKVVNEEVKSLSDQCKLAEKEKREAETRLEVLSNFFKEKEAERQKEEATWLQKQGEVSSTVERLQTMHNEILGYKQQIEGLKREILDQEREYKGQITGLEAKAHEHWVLARQNERRLEESKSESAQLRNRLTLVEKSFNDAEADVKVHRLEANGETGPLYLGAESSSSPIMFSVPGGPPPPPPSYLYGPPLPPYMPPPLPPPGLPPYDISQRPPPLGGRLASPPPMPPLPPSGRYDGPGSLSPPPHSPPLVPYRNFPPFSNERLPLPPSWGDDLGRTGFHPFHRDQRSREKGSLHSSGESLDKSHHSGKV